MGTRDLLFIGLVVGAVSALSASLRPPALESTVAQTASHEKRGHGLGEIVQNLDDSFHELWSEDGLGPAPAAPELTVVRRLSLALTGSIPSLEALRRLERFPNGTMVERRLDELLADRRFADYFAERLARAYVGTEGGPFLLYRRRRFVSWLSDQLAVNRPLDAVVRELIATDGLWTDRPATNFVTVTYDNDRKVLDPERLAGRVSRAFLGHRIDCAQCHDHPFEPWKQSDFQGLAAFFAQARTGVTGILDGPGEFEPTNRKTGKTGTVAPRVPFLPKLLPSEGKRRDRLASWVTNPANPSLARATVNRVWALMTGRPLVEPVDDLAGSEEPPLALDILAEDFRTHGFDLRRLIRVIAVSEVFRLDSKLDAADTTAHERAWAVFPMVRLRPEQVVGSVLQAATLTTLDNDAPIVVRLFKAIGQSQFVERYGDSGEDEFDGRTGTIPQRLLLMNGDLVREKTKPDLFNAATRIGYFAPTDRAAVETAYLTVLTRAPSAAELAHFEATLHGTKGDERGERMSDLLWILVNSTEFSWNH